jgi:hypothetical protein
MLISRFKGIVRQNSYALTSYFSLYLHKDRHGQCGNSTKSNASSPGRTLEFKPDEFLWLGQTSPNGENVARRLFFGGLPSGPILASGSHSAVLPWPASMPDSPQEISVSQTSSAVPAQLRQQHYGGSFALMSAFRCFAAV